MAYFRPHVSFGDTGEDVWRDKLFWRQEDLKLVWNVNKKVEKYHVTFLKAPPLLRVIWWHCREPPSPPPPKCHVFFEWPLTTACDFNFETENYYWKCSIMCSIFTLVWWKSKYVTILSRPEFELITTSPTSTSSTRRNSVLFWLWETEIM